MSFIPENNNALKGSLKRYLLVTLRGMGMGAADVVPGVSGGTIAFITGIYEELIYSIKSIDLEAVRLFFTGRWKSFWKKINGNFLLAVFAGIFISVLSLARLLEFLLDILPQAGPFVPRHHVSGGDIPDYPVDPAIPWDGGFDIRN